MERELRIFEDVESLAIHAASLFEEIARREVSKKGYFTVALSGGSTPEHLYNILSSDYRNKIDWKNVHLFWGDERCVGPRSPESNFRVANDSLISRIDIPAQNIHRIKAELEPPMAAALYEKEITDFFARHGDGRLPSFGLVLLGIGADGHTLSQFPSTKALTETERLVIENYVEKLGAWRITITLPLANNASNSIFLVSGREKARALKDLIDGNDIPASLIKPNNERLLVLADKEAAGEL